MTLNDRAKRLVGIVPNPRNPMFNSFDPDLLPLEVVQSKALALIELNAVQDEERERCALVVEAAGHKELADTIRRGFAA